MAAPPPTTQDPITPSTTPDSTSTSTTNHIQDPSPFRLMDLPAELREQIYIHALAPTGLLTLTTTPSKRHAVHPRLTLSLLRASRTIHAEAALHLYASNQLCLTLNAHDTCWPTISETRLPQRVLRQIQHLCLVLDCTEYFNASYTDVDFDALSALISLKTLRIAMIYRKHYASQTLAPLHIASLREFNVVAQILERVPASTRLAFGTAGEGAGEELKAVVRRLVEARRASRGSIVEEAPESDLRAAATGVVGLVRGCKSGLGGDGDADGDVFAQHRAMLTHIPVALRGGPERV